MSTIWSRNHGSIPVASNTSSTVAPAAQRLLHEHDAAVGRASRDLEDRARLVGAWAARRPSGSCEPRFSSERSAFCSASVKLRPIAIASPTDFMVVVRVASAAGNFSNANRGTLTTT